MKCLLVSLWKSWKAGVEISTYFMQKRSDQVGAWGVRKTWFWTKPGTAETNFRKLAVSLTTSGWTTNQLFAPKTNRVECGYPAHYSSSTENWFSYTKSWKSLSTSDPQSKWTYTSPEPDTIFRFRPFLRDPHYQCSKKARFSFRLQRSKSTCTSFWFLFLPHSAGSGCHSTKHRRPKSSAYFEAHNSPLKMASLQIE